MNCFETDNDAAPALLICDHYKSIRQKQTWKNRLFMSLSRRLLLLFGEAGHNDLAFLKNPVDTFDEYVRKFRNSYPTPGNRPL